MKLSSLARSIETKVVQVRGKDVVVRAVPAEISSEIYAVFPDPRAKLIRNPVRGSEAEPIPDVQDEKYRGEANARSRMRMAAEVAVAIDLELSDGSRLPEKDRAGWLIAAAGEICREFTAAELVHLWGEVQRLGGAQMEEEALKN